MTTLVRLWLLLRGRAAPLAAVLLFVPAALTVAYIAYDPVAAEAGRAGLASAWVVTAIAAYWAFEELLREEFESGACQIYTLGGKELRWFWETTLYGAMLTFVVGAFSFGVSALLFSLEFARPAALLTGLGVYAGGSASLLVTARQISGGAGIGALVGPLLAFPLQMPLLLASAQWTRASLEGGVIAEKWMLLGGFFGILYLLLGQLASAYLTKD